MKSGPVYESPCLWDRLKDEKRPVFLYGTGNGADKILDALLALGVTPEGVFASDGFVRSRSFRGYEVVSYSSVREKYGDDIVVLLCFGTDRAQVTAFIEELDERHTLYIPDVPLYDGEIFNSSYLEKNRDSLMSVREMLSDDTSKEYFDAVINFRLSGKYCYLKTAEPLSESLRSLFDTENIGAVADLGAYKGDTAELFARTFTGCKKIYAVEPDPKTFQKLCAFAEKQSSDNQSIIPLNFAASDREDTVTYSGSASRGAGVQGKNHRAKETQVRLSALDSLELDGLDLIKYDVEGDEASALRGSLETVKRCAPSLAVSLYHKTDDLFALPLYVRSILTRPEEYSFHLRRPPCIPAWDIVFFAVRHQKR